MNSQTIALKINLGSDCISGAHSAIWGKLDTALQIYTLNPCTKFPSSPPSRKVNTWGLTSQHCLNISMYLCLEIYCYEVLFLFLMFFIQYTIHIGIHALKVWYYTLINMIQFLGEAMKRNILVWYEFVLNWFIPSSVLWAVVWFVGC